DERLDDDAHLAMARDLSWAMRGALERLQERERGGEALVGAARHGAGTDLVELGRHRRNDLRQPGHASVQQLVDALRIVVGPEEQASGKELPKDDAHGEDVDADVEWVPERLLWRHVSELSFDLVS